LPDDNVEIDPLDQKIKEAYAAMGYEYIIHVVTEGNEGPDEMEFRENSFLAWVKTHILSSGVSIARMPSVYSEAFEVFIRARYPEDADAMLARLADWRAVEDKEP
jgi:hypothetical protein